MKILTAEAVTETVKNLYIEANTCLSADVLRALSDARAAESGATAADILDQIYENAAIARAERMPICQDTGMAVVFATVGQDIYIEGDINKAIDKGVRCACRDGYLRASVVNDPIRRVNTGDNTPAVVHYAFTPGDKLRLTVLPKGFGSENMGAVKMLTPAEGLAGVEDFVVETVIKAGGNPCPPIVVGIGVGGTADKAALLAKHALLRRLDEPHPDPFWAEAEARLLERINQLQIGPANFGGDTTALGVKIETFPTHIAGLPVAVNISCHALRRAEAVL